MDFHNISIDPPHQIFFMCSVDEIRKTFNMSKTSTVPGLAYLPAREKKTAAYFLEARRKIDGAEGLWRIENKLYDLEIFAKLHPGGAEWIRLTKGTDITELFQVSEAKLFILKRRHCSIC